MKNLPMLLLITLLMASIATGQTWRQMMPVTSPTARFAHCMAYDEARGQVVLFGGVDSSNDTWVWDGTNWTQKFPATMPPARSYSAMTYDRGHRQVVLFGGVDNGGNGFNDTWVWDGSNWTLLHPKNSPSARWTHALAYDAKRGEVILFGGSENDTWRWDGINWRQMNPTTSPPVPGIMTYDTAIQKVVLFEAFDVWVWTGTTWQLQISNAVPPARTNTTLADDPLHNRIILFGGDYGMTEFSDTWAWGGNSWINLLPPPPTPSEREQSFLVTDIARGSVVLFGGIDHTGTVHNDTWIWSGTGFLTFPLMNKTSTTARINSVFDHSMFIGPGQTEQYGYCPDEIVTAYTGETGMSPFNSNPVGTFTCGLPSAYSVVLNGWAQDSNDTPFSVHGQYWGGGLRQYLSYDGHPAYDYVTSDQNADGTLCGLPGCNKVPHSPTPVLAAAPGTIVCINISETKKAPCTEGPGEIKIDHGNGYFTVYLHLLSQVQGLTVNSTVSAQQQIGMSGDRGAKGGPHLHFEVRKGAPGKKCPSVSCFPVDPYGWEGTGPDPYTRAVSIKLWE